MSDAIECAKFESWEEFNQNIQSLETLIRSNIPDVIIPFMPLGLVPGAVLAERLGILDVRPAKIKDGQVVYPPQGDLEGKKVLVVDYAAQGKSIIFPKNPGVTIAILHADVDCNADIFIDHAHPMPPWARMYEIPQKNTPEKTWEEFNTACDNLVQSIEGMKYDCIVPSMRGGLVPAGIIAKKLGIDDIRPILIERVGEKRRLAYDVIGSLENKKVLLLEDDMPTGKGFQFVSDLFYKTRRVETVGIAAVYVNSTSKYIAHFWGHIQDPLPHLPWKPARSGDKVSHLLK